MLEVNLGTDSGRATAPSLSHVKLEEQGFTIWLCAKLAEPMSFGLRGTTTNSANCKTGWGIGLQPAGFRGAGCRLELGAFGSRGFGEEITS